MNIEITGQNLVDKLGINLSSYTTIPQEGHGLYQPKQLLNSEVKFTIDKEDFDKLVRSEGPYKTGSIWRDRFYEVVYFILGQIENNHYVLNLGGDTGAAGSLEKGEINSKDDSRIFCDDVIVAME